VRTHLEIACSVNWCIKTGITAKLSFRKELSKNAPKLKINAMIIVENSIEKISTLNNFDEDIPIVVLLCPNMAVLLTKDLKTLALGYIRIKLTY
jgi:phage-related holin